MAYREKNVQGTGQLLPLDVNFISKDIQQIIVDYLSFEKYKSLPLPPIICKHKWSDMLVGAMAFSLDCRYLAWITNSNAFDNERLFLVDINTGQIKYTKQIESNRSLRFSPDGNFLIAQSDLTDRYDIFLAHSGELVRTIKLQKLDMIHAGNFVIEPDGEKTHIWALRYQSSELEEALKKIRTKIA